MTKIHVIEIQPISRYNEDSIQGNATTEISGCKAIQLENETHLQKSNQRKKIFEEILFNNCSTDIGCLKGIPYGLLSIVASLLSTCCFTLIPLHNVIIHSQFGTNFCCKHC